MSSTYREGTEGCFEFEAVPYFLAEIVTRSMALLHAAKTSGDTSSNAVDDTYIRDEKVFLPSAEDRKVVCHELPRRRRSLRLRRDA